MESFEVRSQFIELRAKGYSFDKISRQLSVAKKTLVTWSKEYEAEIRASKALELETLLEEQYMLKEQRLTHFGRLLKGLDKEIEKRGFSDVSTEKLLELRLKFDAALRDELPEPCFLSEVDVRAEKEAAALLQELSSLNGSNDEEEVA